MAHSLASGCGGRVRGHKNPLAKYFYIIILYNNVVYGLQLVRLFVNFVPIINCLTLIIQFYG